MINRLDGKRMALAATLALFRPLPSLAQPQFRMDGDLVSAIKAVNDAEIEAGRAAETAVSSEDVKDFARKMVAEHAASNAKIDRWLAADGGVSAAEGPLTRTLRAGAARDRELLAGLTGASYEKRYIAQQIAGHQAALTLINSEGRMASQAMTGLLEDTRNLIIEHLSHARMLQARIGTP